MEKIEKINMIGNGFDISLQYQTLFSQFQNWMIMKHKEKYEIINNIFWNGVLSNKIEWNQIEDKMQKNYWI